MRKGSGQGNVLWVPVGGACNSRCAMCEQSDVPEITPDGVRAAAEEARPAVLVITGPGEPTIRRDLDALVHAARRGGAGHVALVTNGRAFAYPRVASAVASLGFSHIVVSLLHHEATAHDEIVRVQGAHEQVIAGLRHIVATARPQGTVVAIRTVVHERIQEGIIYLSELAERFGASWVWLDLGGSHDGEVPEVRAGILPLHVGREVRKILLQVPFETRSRRGSVPARMHPDEGAVSIVVRTGCRNACSFCTTRIIQEANLAAWPLDDLRPFHASLKEGVDNGYKSLRFVAVEPLEHPDLPELISVASEMGYTRIESWTSGRALADREWAEMLCSAGLTHVDVPLFGPNARVHDTVAGVEGSFEETVQGLRTALELFDVVWHLVVIKQNMGSMDETVRMGRELGLGDPSSVLIPAPSSEDPAVFERFASKLGDVAYSVAVVPGEIRRLLLGRGIANQIPPCILERTEGIDPGFLSRLPPPPMDWVREGSLDQPGAALKLRSPCPLRDECAARSRCPGYHAMYPSIFGIDEFVPLTGE